MLVRLTLVASIFGSSFACIGKTPDTGETDGDADTDSDADSDSDTDTDSDTDIVEETGETGHTGETGRETGETGWVDTGDTGGTPSGIEGSTTYLFTYDGVDVCDLDIVFSGTPYSGSCSGCDFAFSMDSIVTEDRSAGDCTPLTFLTFIPEASYIADVTLFHYPTNYYYYIDNALMVGTALDLTSYGGSYYSGPYFQAAYGGGIISFESSYYTSYGTYKRTGDTVDWTFHYDGTEAVLSFEEDCPADYGGYNPFVDTYDSDPEAGTGTGAGTASSEDVACDGTLADSYTFTGSGNTVDITVDTVAKDSAVDLILYVNGPKTASDGSKCDGTIHMSDDAYACSFVPASGWLCPALSIDTIKGGVYTVYVLGTNAVDTADSTIHPDCDSITTGEYTIQFAEGSTDVSVTLDDDIPGLSEVSYAYDAVATATLK